MASAAASPSGFAAVGFVASRDLMNEKLITLCLVLSVVAVLTPILLLTSVKVGFIDRLRAEFVEDLSFRQIRPAAADLRQEAFFDEVRGWEHVTFIAPSVMLTPREVDYVVEGGSRPKRGSAKLWPSGPSDPLLAKLTGAPPSGSAVVLSSDLAAAAGLTVGAPFKLSVSRVENDQRKRVEIAATVSGLIDDALVPQPTILADPSIDRNIEDYRAGIAVPDRGWGGTATIPKQSFETLVVAAKEPLGESAASDLRIRVGASKVEEITRDDVAALLGAKAAPQTDPAQGWTHFYRVDKAGRLYTGVDIGEANAVLANRQARAAGANAPVAVRLLGQDATLVGYDPMLLGQPADPPPGWAIRPQASYALNNRVYLPASLKDAWTGAGSPRLVDIEVATPAGWATRALAVTAEADGFVEGDAVVGSASLLGMIRRGADVPVTFDKGANSIVEQAAGYRGFRIVADGIDAVPPLVERLQASGVEVRAKSDEILKLQKLERSLNILIAVVATVALGGGYAILSSSFYANVQRKRVEFATMRLIGMRKRTIFQIPVVQAFMIAITGYVASVVLYGLVSTFLNTVVAKNLQFDGQLSKLYLVHFVVIGVFVIFGSCVAALAASREATRIDPAQAIRAA